MQVLQAVMPVGRAGTLRSARLPRHMVGVEGVLAMAQHLQARGVVVEVSGQKGQHQTQQAHTEVVAVETGLHQTV